MYSSVQRVKNIVETDPKVIQMLECAYKIFEKDTIYMFKHLKEKVVKKKKWGISEKVNCKKRV